MARRKMCECGRMALCDVCREAKIQRMVSRHRCLRLKPRPAPKLRLVWSASKQGEPLLAKIAAHPAGLPKGARPAQMMWRQASRMGKDESDESIEIKVHLQVEGNVRRIERVEVQPAAIGTVKP